MALPDSELHRSASPFVNTKRAVNIVNIVILIFGSFKIVITTNSRSSRLRRVGNLDSLVLFAFFDNSAITEKSNWKRKYRKDK